jgi:hypothetical protein
MYICPIFGLYYYFLNLLQVYKYTESAQIYLNFEFDNLA